VEIQLEEEEEEEEAAEEVDWDRIIRWSQKYRVKQDYRRKELAFEGLYSFGVQQREEHSRKKISYF